MYSQQMRWTGIGVSVIGGALLYPYFFAGLSGAGVGLAALLSLLASALVAGASALIVTALAARTRGQAWWVAPVLLLLSYLAAVVQKGSGGGEVLRTAGLYLLQASVVVWFGWACIYPLIQFALPSNRAGRPGGMTLFLSLALALIIVAAAVIWFGQSDYVWYWDYDTYSVRTVVLADSIRNNGLLHALGLVLSTLDADYNFVPALPLALVDVITGHHGRTTLIAAIAAIYVVPTVLAGAWLVYRASQARLGGPQALLVSAVALALFPVMFYSPLYGMPDIGGVLLLALIVAIRYQPAPTGRGTPAELAALLVGGGLMVAACVFRRWYVLIMPPLLLVLVARELLHNDGAGWQQRVRAALMPLLLLGAAITLTGFAFYWPRVIAMLTTNYSAEYKAYAVGHRADINNAIDNFGYGPVAAGLAALLYLATRQPTRLVALGSAFVLVTTIVLFIRVQSFAVHHYLLVLPTLAFAVALALGDVLARQPRLGYALLAAAGLCSALTVNAVLTPDTPHWWAAQRLTPTIDMRPPRRTDMAELDRLTHDLGQYAASNAAICVAASGKVLNQSIFREAAASADAQTAAAVADHFVWLSDVDRRDGPSIHFPQCNIVVITEPVDLHLKSSEQQSVAFLDKDISAGTGIGASFAGTGQRYALMEGYQALIYMKTRAIDTAALQAYVNAVVNK